MAEQENTLSRAGSVGVVEDSRTVYDFLHEEIEQGKHGQRFAVRPFSMLPSGRYPSPLDVSRAYFEPVDMLVEHRLKLAETIGTLVMPKDYPELVAGLKELYKREDVTEHLTNGGTLKLIDGHYTYVGQVMLGVASWHAQNELGMPTPEQHQTTIVSRITGLFTLGLLTELYDKEGWQGHGGMIFEDVLLPFSGALQTLPNSPTGSRFFGLGRHASALRRSIVKVTKDEHAKIVAKGAHRLIEGSSATEIFANEERTLRIIGKVTKKTAELSTEPKDENGKQKVLLVPTFMQCNPFGDKYMPIKARPTPFAILEPRYIKTHQEFHETMVELACAATRYKTSGELQFGYEEYPTELVEPRIIYGHKVSAQ